MMMMMMMLIIALCDNCVKVRPVNDSDTMCCVVRGETKAFYFIFDFFGFL